MNELETLKKILRIDGINSKQIILEKLNDLEYLKSLRRSITEEINKGARNGK